MRSFRIRKRVLSPGHEYRIDGLSYPSQMMLRTSFRRGQDVAGDIAVTPFSIAELLQQSFFKDPERSDRSEGVTRFPVPVASVGAIFFREQMAQYKIIIFTTEF
ncbi:hypothetical protein AVEN_57125-1 [Araneus ventricosus]|uniref:Uncharacterized protein n=1 Tax=Araneus ventricosus TaxID=182803 RepID=A0A4Y2HAK2_ARAVE|nr:hypothetical protein AVEN_57125-1 [Araneus ventricosus]